MRHWQERIAIACGLLALICGVLVATPRGASAATQRSIVAHAPALNDYPWNGLTGGDGWGMGYGQCVSYDAWKLYELKGGTQYPSSVPAPGWMPSDASRIPINSSWGNANHWYISAQQAGIPADGTPQVGDVAEWHTYSQFSVGHVAYVSQVNADGSIDLAQYNLRENSQFSTLHMVKPGVYDTSFGDPAFWVPWPDSFIHFAPPSHARTPTVVTHPDGRLEAFMVGATGALYHTWQTSAGGGWTSAGWVSLGGNWPNTSRPIVATDGGNQLEVFLRGTTGNLYVNTERGSWASWKALGTFTAIGDPTVVRNPDGRLEVFAVGAGSDHSVWHDWQTSAGVGNWAYNWSNIGGYWPNGNPTVATDGSNQLEVLMRGTTGNLYVNTQQGGWASWNALGTFTSISDPAVVRNSDGRLEVFAIGAGSDHSVWHDWQTTAGTGNWTYNWSNIGGNWPTETPAVALDGSNQLEVLMRGTTGNIYVNAQQSGWSGWNTIDSRFTSISDAAVTRNSDGRLEVFAVGGGSDHSVWHNWQTTAGTGNWSSGWSDLGGYWPN